MRRRTTLGRQIDCHVCLAGKQVSRQHALILCDGGQHFVEDLGSSNGTYLNGNRLAPHTPGSAPASSTSRRYRILPGAMLWPGVQPAFFIESIRESISFR